MGLTLFEIPDLAEMVAEREAIGRHDGALSPVEALQRAKTDSEVWRHQCEVRSVLAARLTRGRQHVDDYIALVAAKRGPEMAERLRADAAAQWAKGNRGKRGDWR